MVLKLYNTLTRTEEEFKPLKDGVATMYSCGPTVYDYAHIGNWRTFVVNDLLRRTLQFNGLQVKHVMNITDVDDKTINGSKAAGIPLAEFTKKYEQIFLNDLATLNILPPTILTHATEFIPQMIALIQKLIDSGHAYKTSDGVYFKVSSFADYGKLSKQPIEATDRPDDESHDKQDRRDFALWKFETPEDNGNGWDTNFGRGRPGWHIECSAMSQDVLGETLDIHTGGSDLVFPHHENEIAQSESATGKTFANYWLHTAFLQVDGHKMSKSLNNFYTLKDLTTHNISPLAYRYWLLTGHYRSPVNFTWEALGGAQTALERLQRKVSSWSSDIHKATQVDENYKQKFLAAINNDLNLPQALAVVWEMLDDYNLEPNICRTTFLDFDKVLGLGLDKIKQPSESFEIPVEIIILRDQREEARKNKDWTKADQFRQEIEAKGFVIDDTSEGSIIKPDHV